MYKTQYSLEVHITGVDDSTQLEDSAALHQIKSCQNIDVPGLIIPYHAVEYVVVTTTRTETEDPVDDNCIVDGDGGGEDTGTLTIVADAQIYNGDFVFILVSEALDGHYGPLEFSSDDQGTPFPDGYLSYAIAPTMAAGESITVPDLPVGMSVLCSNNGETATVPGTLHVAKTG